MMHWVNVHDPPEENGTPDYRVWIQKKGKKRKTQISKGDLVIIYETLTSPGTVSVKDGNREKKLTFKKRGRGGAIAIVKIGEWQRKKNYVERGIKYFGYFKTTIFKRKVVLREKINSSRKQKNIKEFNPRIFGGLRELKDEEWKIFRVLFSI